MKVVNPSSVSPPPAPAAKRTRKAPFWFGGVAASMAASCTHPLDLAKVRMQTTRRTNGVFSTLAYSVKQYGIQQGLYAGLSASILRQMTYSLTRFAVYDELKHRLSEAQSSERGNKPVPAWKMATAACIAGGIAGVAGNPADVILVRMMSDANKPEEKRVHYKHCFDGLARMIREEGLGSLFRGMGPNVTRAILMNASQLVTYDVFKDKLLDSGMKDGLGLHFLSSFGAGTVATTICAPFDVIKSRMMSASGNYTTISTITRAFRNEGFTWLFKGWTPAWIRLSPNTILIFVFLEQMKSTYFYFKDL